MTRTTCPFLGLQDDPTTALDFPSEGNYCHHAQPISPIKGEYQEVYCLTAEHTICPLYQAAQPQPLPPAMAEPSYTRSLSRRKLALIAGPLLLVGIAALLVTWNVFGSRFGWLNFITNTGGRPQADELSMLYYNLPGGTPSAEPTPTNSARPLVANCALPDGWVPYIVRPTDSLFRMSVIYGITIADLQRINCMGQKTTLLPGQVMYVPFIPTAAPTITDMPTATNTFAQNNSQVYFPGNNGIPDSPSATPAPPPPQASPLQPTPVPPSSNPQPISAPTNPPANPPPPQPHSQPTAPPGNNNGGNGNGNGNGGNGNGGNGHGHGHGNGNGNGGNGHGNGGGHGH